MTGLAFHFLQDPAGFSLSESLLDLPAQALYLEVLVAGLLNTLKVAVPALVFCTLLGGLIGLGRVQKTGPWKACCDVYVGALRNIPLLLQLLALYFGLTRYLPIASEAWSLGDALYLSKSGLALPVWQGGGWQLPVRGRFSVEGGLTLSPEYLTLLLGLSLYTAAFVAEVVRAGVQSVPVGQVQAGLALGLSPAQNRRLIVLPLALRLVVPPLGNQYLGLLKNASLGVAIGYPELVSVSNTAMNQSGRVVECVLMVMLMYAALSGLTAVLMNALNRRVNYTGLTA